MSHTEIINYVKKHPNKFTYEELAQRYERSENAIRGIIGRGKLRHLILKQGTGGVSCLTKERKVKTKQELHDQTRLEIALREKAKQQKEVERKYKLLQDEVVKTRKALDQALEIGKHIPKITKIQATRPKTDGGGTAVICASDWHVDELVPPNKVNNLNEYTPDIAKRRAMKFFELAVRFLRVDRNETSIDNLILWLGGDFFTSSEMHGASCAFPPIIAAMYAQDLICSGLEYLIKEEPNLKIHIVGSVGNHSRISGSDKPVNQAIEQELSLEWMMYHAIQARYKGNKNLTFQLDNSYHTYTKIYDKVIRFNHGHLGWRFNDGMGGVHGPLWKTISQKWDKQIKADLTVCGHYHQYTPASRARSYLVNGSLIGLTPYSMQFGNEEPIQAYFLVHSKYGIVGQRPLFVGI